MNHKRSNSALDGTPSSYFSSYFQEPPLRKVSNGGSFEELSKRSYSSAPMISLLTKYNLINRSQNAFYDILVPEIDMQQLVLPRSQQLKAKSLSSSCISPKEDILPPKESKSNESEHFLFGENNNDMNQFSRNEVNQSEQPSQPQLLETRAREESCESSLFSVDGDDCQDNDKCNLFTEFQEIVVASCFDEEHKISEEQEIQLENIELNPLGLAQSCNNEQLDELNIYNNNSENNNNNNNNSNSCDQFRIIEFGSF